MPYHLRRTDREITEPDRIEALIREGQYTTIALADEHGPYAVTLSYGYEPDSGRLYFHCAADGRKISALTGDSRACASIVHDRGYKMGECAHPYESVVLHGRLRRVEDAEEKLHGLRVLIEHLEDHPDAFSHMGFDDPKRADGVTVLCFDIESRSAKQGE